MLPSLIVVADDYSLLWRFGEPLKPRLAKILAERMAKEIGGVPAMEDPCLAQSCSRPSARIWYSASPCR